MFWTENYENIQKMSPAAQLHWLKVGTWMGWCQKNGTWVGGFPKVEIDHMYPSKYQVTPPGIGPYELDLIKFILILISFKM